MPLEDGPPEAHPAHVAAPAALLRLLKSGHPSLEWGVAYIGHDGYNIASCPSCLREGDGHSEDVRGLGLRVQLRPAGGAQQGLAWRAGASLSLVTR